VPQTGGSETATWRHLGMVAGVTAGTGIYYAAFEPLGYIVSTAIYLLALMAWFNRGKWTANVLSAVLFSILSFIMFVKLDVNLPRGLAAFSWVSDAVVAILNPIVNVFKAVLALFQSGGPR
jgi:hypothetical protein